MAPRVGVLLLLNLVIHIHGVPSTIKIGAIFHDGDEQHKAAFEYALTSLNEIDLAPQYDLAPIVKWVNVSTDSFSTARATCELLEEGVAAIFGTGSPFTRGIVSSIATRFDIPHIEYSWRRIEDSVPPPNTLNLYPDSKNVSEAIAMLLKSMKWRSYTAIYETDDGLSRIQDALKLHGPSDLPVTVRQLGEGPDYRPLLKEIARSLDTNILLDVETNHVIDVLKQAKEVKLLEDYHRYIVTELDIYRLPILREFNNSRANITGFRLLSNKSSDIAAVLNFEPTVETALLYDAVFLFNKALNTLFLRNKDSETPLVIEPEPLSCEGNRKYEAGRNLTNLMREVPIYDALTGSMGFDKTGQRKTFDLEVVEFQRDQYVTTGVWNNKGLQFTRTEEAREGDVKKNLDKTFMVTTRLGAPYLMEVIDGSGRGVKIGNKQYEGYSIDLIHAVRDKLGIECEFELVPDGRYGSFNHETKSWDGLVKRLLDHKADLAICDLTITYEREQAVDFTMPFMNLGISILYSKPVDKPPNLFSFLSPLSTDVWIYMATAYLGVSVMLFLQARMAPAEWDNPHPCNPDPEELENCFSLMNSLWLTMGSLMQQGSDILPKASPGEWSPPHPCIAEPTELEFSLTLSNSLWHNIGSLMQQGSDVSPKAPSIRMVAGMWWFFTLIMVSSYTANLAAFLTVEKMDVQINNAEDLAKQTKIKYGAVDGGSTLMFFKESNFSTYQRMWAAMADTKPSVFTKDNDEGVERVIKGKRAYAFLMESTSIEYRVERDCGLTQVGGLLDSKGYGIAMPLNSPYRTAISGAVLKLQESGELGLLKTKWWKEMHGGGTCSSDVDEEEVNSSELGMANVGGVFLVLMCGCAASFIVGVLEFLWNVRKVAVEEKVTPCEALVAELRFAMNIWAETKPVKVAQSSSGSLSSAGGRIGRAASAARSMVGSFLRLDILDKVDKDNNINNRSDNSKMN